MILKNYIPNYAAHIKKPVTDQIQSIAKEYCAFHGIDYSALRRNTGVTSMRIKMLHRLLRDASVIYSCDAQEKALGVREYLILRRINDTHQL